MAFVWPLPNGWIDIRPRENGDTETAAIPGMKQRNDVDRGEKIWKKKERKKECRKECRNGQREKERERER